MFADKRKELEEYVSFSIVLMKCREQKCEVSSRTSTEIKMLRCYLYEQVIPYLSVRYYMSVAICFNEYN